jgi:hypothetical protein
MFTDSAILTLFVCLTIVTHMRYLVSNGRATVNHGSSTLYGQIHCHCGKDRKGRDLKGRLLRFVDGASLYNLVNRTNLVHNFS